jgi:tetratricopeptide (TPR) repeat protein
MSSNASTSNFASVHALRFVLILLGVVILIGGLATATLPFMLGPKDDKTGALVLPALGVAAACTLIAALLWCLATILRLLALQVAEVREARQRIDRLHEELGPLQETLAGLPELLAERPTVIAEQTKPVENYPPAAPANHGQDAGPAQQQMLELLRQLRDLGMMSEAQRLSFAQSEFLKRKQGMVKQIERAIAMSHWQAAEDQIRELQHLLPEDADAAELAARVAGERSTRLHQDLEAARIQLRHLMSIGAWPQAEEILESLLHRYPAAADVRSLADEVQHEKTSYEAENYQRLVLELKDATDHRQWRRAVATAEELIRRFPNEKKIEKLRTDLPTLVENAESQERREHESQFKDLLHRQRYEEALEVAKRVIEKYPASTAATELMKLLPKVQELIAQEKSRRQATATKAE